MQAAQPFGFVGDIGNAIEKHAKRMAFQLSAICVAMA